MGGKPPCPLRPTKFANEVRTLQLPMRPEFTRPLPPRLPLLRPPVEKLAKLRIKNWAMGGCITCAGWCDVLRCMVNVAKIVALSDGWLQAG